MTATASYLEHPNRDCRKWAARFGISLNSGSDLQLVQVEVEIHDLAELAFGNLPRPSTAHTLRLYHAFCVTSHAELGGEYRREYEGR